MVIEIGKSLPWLDEEMFMIFMSKYFAGQQKGVENL